MKILLFFLIFSSMVYSQAVQKLKEIDTRGRPIAEYITDTTPLPIRTISHATSTNYWQDNIDGIDTSSHNFQHLGRYNFITVKKDTAVVDTLIVEYYEESIDMWTSTMIGLKDMYTDTLVASTATLIIPSAETKKYMINQPYAGYIRVRWKAEAGKEDRLLEIIYSITDDF